MIEFTKSEKKELRKLCGEAYEIELSAELSKLENDFARWKLKQIDSFDLDQVIHEYYSGARKYLFGLYARRSNEDFAVARAVATGNILPTKISPSLFAKLESTVTSVRNNSESQT